MSYHQQVSGAHPIPRLRITFLGASILFTLALVAASWVFVLVGDRRQAHPFLSAETLSRAWSFLKDLLGVGVDRTPAFLQGSQWQQAASLAVDTLSMSVLAIGLAGIGAITIFMFGARNVMVGDLAPYGKGVGAILFLVVRGLFTLSRGVPELVWAMLIVFIFLPGILPGAIALAVHNWGILGKLSAEIVEGLDPRPIRALQSTGASQWQVLAYAVLPQALPRFMTYLFYRWEVIIRTTIVVGFVASGGLGTAFRLSMSHFHYTTVALLLTWYILLVVAVDLASALFRRMAR